MHDVLELTHVSGPGVLVAILQERRGWLLLGTITLVEPIDEMVDENADIGTALAERRQVNDALADSIKEILAHDPVPNDAR
jgi:hypothetical protein